MTDGDKDHSIETTKHANRKKIVISAIAAVLAAAAMVGGVTAMQSSTAQNAWPEATHTYTVGAVWKPLPGRMKLTRHADGSMPVLPTAG